MKEASYHLTLLAQNRIGFQNLIKLASAAFLEGFYLKPRIDKELLAAHSEGLICLSGCVSGEFSRTLLHGDSPRSRPGSRPGRSPPGSTDVFGDRYFIEIQNNGLEIQRLALEGVGRNRPADGLAAGGHQRCPLCQPRRCRSPGRAAVHQHGQVPHRHQSHADGGRPVLSAQPRGNVRRVSRPRRGRRPKPADRRQRRHRAGTGQAAFSQLSRPPAGKTPTDYLRELCLDGLDGALRRRSRAAGPTANWRRRCIERLDRELDVIDKLGFPELLSDRLGFRPLSPASATFRPRPAARASARWWPTRLYLSHVCPLKYDLLFERFLDVSRLEAPDIDIDFCKDRRGEVIQYVKEKYGDGERRPDRHVRHAGGPGRDSRRRPGAGHADSARRCDRGHGARELHITLDKALDNSADLKKAYDSDARSPRADRPGDEDRGAGPQRRHARRRGGDRRSAADRIRAAERVQNKEEIITQWAMGDVEAAGLLKMDFLGPAEPDDSVQGRRADRANDRPADRSLQVSARRRTKRSPCSAAAKPRASSSSKAAAFATCCRR